MATTTSPNMDLLVPSVDVTTDPEWATSTNSNWATIDLHDHTFGNGVPVPTAGLNINAALPMGGFALGTLASSTKAIVFGQQSSLTGANSIYMKDDGNFYVNVGDGTAVQITSGHTVNALSGSGFTGLGGTTGSAWYNTPANTFSFLQSGASPNATPHKYATLQTGSLIVYDDTLATPTHGVTIKSIASLAANAALTLPAVNMTLLTALPGSTLPLLADSSGAMSTGTITSAMITNGTIVSADISASAAITGSQLSATAGITKAQQAALGQVTSTTSTGNTTSTSSAIPGDITNMVTPALTTSGRPIMIMAIPDGTVHDCSFGISSGSDTGAIYLGINVSGSATGTVWRTTFETGLGLSGVGACPVSAMFAFYPAAAGTYTFQAQYAISVGTTCTASYMKLVAWEL